MYQNNHHKVCQYPLTTDSSQNFLHSIRFSFLQKASLDFLVPCKPNSKSNLNFISWQMSFKTNLPNELTNTITRGVGDGWAEWTIAHPGFVEDRNTNRNLLLFDHPALGSFLRH